MRKAIALGAIVLMAAGCTIAKSKDTWAFTPGKGCIYSDGETLIAESDGISINLASMLQGMTAMVSAVFGANTQEKTERAIESGEGCRGVLDQLFEEGKVGEDAGGRRGRGKLS